MLRRINENLRMMRAMKKKEANWIVHIVKKNRIHKLIIENKD